MKMPKDYENGPACVMYLHENNEANTPQMNLCLLIQVQLPAKKHRKAIQMLCKDLPEAVQCFIEDFDRAKLEEALQLAQKQREIRAWLSGSPYCVFVANGSILPRAKGTQQPLSGAIPFVAPPGDEIEVCGVRGMGIRRGVTVITGGGYSGKSTLLDAISAGIYDHVGGDGRELVITDERAIKISAEDGRSVKQVNISPFIKWLPGGDTRYFSTEHASGSTSQAANIMEAVNAQMRLLLIDEDKSATNFMIRDHMMKALIEKEPITPFTDRVRELYEHQGVSTILVIGGSGEYLAVADQIYKMDDYVIADVTERAKAISEAAGIVEDRPSAASWEYKRWLEQEGFTSYPEDCGTERLEVSDMGFILIGDERIDIRMLHHVVSEGQLTALGFLLRKLEVRMNQEVVDVEDMVADLYEEIEREGIEAFY
ncbi:MAG: P-loop domain-containing protein, partial [Plesiomonas sp.]